MEQAYYVYLLTNRHNTVLYVGVTRDLVRRLEEHRAKAVPGFTARYNLEKLVYYEQLMDPYQAIQREKQIKAGPRARKEALIQAFNPGWEDLAERL